MDDSLATHRIDPEALRSDNFDTFWFQRKQALVALIETAMGKHTARDHDWAAWVNPALQGIAHAIIQNRLPAPAVGLDLTDEHGRVTCTAEMAWPELHVAIVSEPHTTAPPGWVLFNHQTLANDIDPLVTSLAQADDD